MRAHPIETVENSSTRVESKRLDEEEKAGNFLFKGRPRDAVVPLIIWPSCHYVISTLDLKNHWSSYSARLRLRCFFSELEDEASEPEELSELGAIMRSAVLIKTCAMASLSG